MTVKILMPSLSPTMIDGNLTKWLVKEGDKVAAGDLIAEIETDKATMEIETVEGGIVKELLFKEGSEAVKINTPIAIIEEKSLEEKNNNLNKKKDIEIFDKKEDDLTNNLNKKINKKSKTKTFNNKNVISMREAIRDALREEMKKNDKVFIIGEEVGEYQ